jgi:ribose transport system substrate-binding protein
VSLLRRSCLAVVVAGAIPLVVAACGNSDESSGAAKSGEGDVAVVLPNVSHPFWGQMKVGVDDAAANASDVNVKVIAGSRDLAPEEIVTQVQDALVTSPDVLLLGHTPEELKPVLRQALEDGVKVVAMNTPVEGVDITSYVGVSNSESGKAAGEYLAGRLSAGDTVAIMHCLAGNDATDERVAAFEDAIEGTGIKVVATLDAKCDLEKGRAVMEDLLTSHSDLDAMYSVSDDQTLGALQAVEADDRPIIVSIGPYPDAIEQIPGKLDADISIGPYEMGEEGTKTAIAVAKGEQVEKTIDTGVEVITEENASEFLQTVKGG